MIKLTCLLDLLVLVVLIAFMVISPLNFSFLVIKVMEREKHKGPADKSLVWSCSTFCIERRNLMPNIGNLCTTGNEYYWTSTYCVLEYLVIKM